MKRLGYWSLLALGALLLPWAGLVLSACFTALPPSLHTERAQSRVLVVDRDGRLLREVVVGDGAPAEPVSLEELSPWVVPALLAAEDARFFEHPGVDPLAVARALVQLVLDRRVTSGASTLTQQLARTLEPRPRTLLGKLREMRVALRIEASLSKQRILEEYLSRVAFGPNLIGIQAASRRYFQKPAGALDLAQAAALVSLARGPALYDPSRRPQLLERRRLRVLERLAVLGSASREEIARAELTPLHWAEGAAPLGVEHFSFALARRFGVVAGERASVLHTTLQAGLQREVEQIVTAAGPALRSHGGGAVSAVVLDNDSGDVLAYVGSPDYFDAARLGANDGVVAERQPGSALKPFLYAAAMQELGYGAATLLPDLPREFATPAGTFAPRDYDQRFRGPVLLRQALGSSLNLPALEVASRLGPTRLLSALRNWGFSSLERDAEHYGVGLALGNGEVTLLELAGAYAALARGGELLEPRLALARSERGGRVSPLPRQPSRRVLRPEIAALISEILADDAARAAGFGRDSALALPFPVAAKTGTSKGFRDNWALGYTREITVGVWVGNFDGSPLREASGLTTAGPVFHRLMLAAMRDRRPAPLVPQGLLSRAEVCTLSGKAPGAACLQRRRESFVPGHEPRQTCDLHVERWVDAHGREVDARCSGSRRVFEIYPVEYLTWARQAGRPLAGASVSPRCPPAAVPASVPQLTSPRDGQVLAIDPDGPARQEVLLSASSSAASVTFIVDGKALAPVGPPFRLPWPLHPGEHRVQCRAGDALSAEVTFRVSGPFTATGRAEPAPRHNLPTH